MKPELLQFFKKVYTKLFSSKQIRSKTWADRLSGQTASDYIKKLLESSEPVMICRLGSVELDCIANYVSVKNNNNQFLKYIKGEIAPFWWDKELISKMNINAGFFPSTPENLEKFSELMLEDMKQVDVLGSWIPMETLFADELSDAVKVFKDDLLSFHHEVPYTMVFEGKKILVIHPFEDSIKKQYEKRELLFKDKRVLPDFELKTLKAIQTIGNNTAGFKDWFEALDYMKNKISEIDFDIAIIGCGAYGFPLAAHVKRIGKKALHIGGPTQILFGIMGKRWETEPGNDYISKNFANEHWSRPLPTEIPEDKDKVEDGCYW